MLRQETDLEIDLLQKKIGKKDREVRHLKLELESMNELDLER